MIIVTFEFFNVSPELGVNIKEMFTVAKIVLKACTRCIVFESSKQHIFIDSTEMGPSKEN